ncbi:hypothetical protein, partial [Pseudomonas syringae group genomosp. 7]|uniref:hypothetical protein n=1 Tax=Pseudomonas syringae group genomosp. 7 TaxID=251699 RepID=UPI0037705796
MVGGWAGWWGLVGVWLWGWGVYGVGVLVVGLCFWRLRLVWVVWRLWWCGELVRFYFFGLVGAEGAFGFFMS